MPPARTTTPATARPVWPVMLAAVVTAPLCLLFLAFAVAFYPLFAAIDRANRRDLAFPA